MSLGIALIAHDNKRIAYGKLATLNALLIKIHLPNTPVFFLTDDETDYDPKYFDHIEKIDRVPHGGTRSYVVDDQTSVDDIFKNGSRPNIYDLTPFDETLVIDLDYLIYDPKTLLGLSQHRFDIALNTQIRSIIGPDNVVVKKIAPESIDQQWATVVYFRKSEVSRTYFRIVREIHKQYEWYANLYKFNPDKYRNDFTFSIASHIMNSYSEHEILVGSLPNPSLLFAWDHDYVVGYHRDGLIFNANKGNTPFPVRTKNQNIHVLNKMSLLNDIDEMIEFYDRELYIRNMA